MDVPFIAAYLTSSDRPLRIVPIAINSDYRLRTQSFSSATLKAGEFDDLQATVHLWWKVG